MGVANARQVLAAEESNGAHPGRFCRSDPVRRILDNEALARQDVECVGGVQKEVRSRFAVFDLLCDTIRAAQDAGDVAKGDPARMGMVAWSMLHGVAALVVDGQMERAGVRDDHIEEFTRRVARTAYAGLTHWPLPEVRSK